MKISSKLGGLVAVLGVAGMLLVTGGGSAQASEPIAPQAAAPVLAKDSVTGYNVKDGTLYGADLAPAVVAWFTGTWDNTVTTNSVKDGALREQDLSDAVKAKLNAPEVFGKGSVVNKVPPTTIKFIGGSFNDPDRGKTLVGKFDLEAGTWLLTTNGKFTRTEAAAAGEASTRPMLGLRYDETADNAFGEDAGTIMGADISPVADQDLTGSAVQTVTLTKNTTIKVYAFGYDDARGSTASGKITAAANTTATRLG